MNQRWSTDLQLPLHIYSTNWPRPLMCILMMRVPWMKNLFPFSLLIWKGSVTLRNENSEALSYSGRAKAPTVILEIDIKGDISDNMADPIHRKNVFVASKYGKAPAKSSSVMSWKRSRIPLLFYVRSALYSLCLWYQTAWSKRWVVS